MESFINAASVAFSFLSEGFYINLNWLGQFVRIIIEGVGVVGIGVIVFTLILKAITTPFDIYQRIKMRKQTLIMRSMRGDLEKLQKQYANDKQTYQMKMMELQKKNGYSVFGACLPMIISLVILIVAVTAFQSFSQYTNLAMYEQMACAYNEAVREYAVDGIDYRLPGSNQESDRPAIDWNTDEPYAVDGVIYAVIENNGIMRMQVSSEDENIYLYYVYSLEETSVNREYRIDIEKVYTNQKNTEIKETIQEYIDAGYSEEDACLKYFHEIGAEAAAEWFREDKNNPGFLWIKNVWYPDVSYSHPIQEYSSFTNSFSKKILSENWEGEKSIGDVISETDYNLLTAHLETEKSQANGYYIMIVLTIGLMVLSQFVSMKSQKESNQYQTVDGQGAKTQKIMMIALPLIYAITGFMWTAAFSIYIAVSSFISILVTLLSNLIIDRMFKKKEEAEIKQKYTRTLPWQQSEQKNKKRKK